MPRRRFQSFEVLAFILINIIVFFHQEALTPINRIAFDDRYGAVPVLMGNAWSAFRESGLHRAELLAALPLVTANYLHADVGHIGGNMIFFWIFGSVLSRTVGRTLFILTYVLAGMIAVLVYVHTNPTSEAPMIGASGAIAGLEGAYFTFVLRWEVPHANVWPFAGPVPAMNLAFLAIVNFVLDTGAFVGHSAGHVAYGAHVGGFLGGALVAMVVASFWHPKWREA
jgi:membrane associated rhomboid family serine protease